MSHEAYICYDEKDKKVSDAVNQVFLENNISTWIKSKNMPSDGTADQITNAIEQSKCFILIYSENSKNTNYVITETDIAFSREIPIIVFNIDDVSIDKDLEFILETQEKINAFPNYKKQLKQLVNKTSKFINKPAGNIKLNSNSIKIFGEIDPYKTQNNIKKYVKIAIPVIAVVILIYFFVILPIGHNTTDDGIFSMNVTDVKVSGDNGGYKYTVYGESFNMPSDSANYLMNIQFFDQKDNMVFEINSTADEFKSGIICSYTLNDDNVTHIGFKLIDLDDNVLSEENYVIK